MALQQVSFAVVALFIWLVAFAGSPLAGALELFFTSMHMVLLGALITLSQRPLYNLLCLGGFGLDPLTDQQLGGAIMLIFGGAVYLVRRTLFRAPCIARQACDMKNLSAISLLGLVSFLGLALFWAAGGVSLKQVMGWGYRVVYTPEPQGKVEESINRVAAVHYDLVCATCHGSPADPQRGKQLRLSPPAPSLHLRAGEMPPEMMFQAVKDGIQNTAMPGWPASGRDDEVWLMVAFLEKLPNLSAESIPGHSLFQ